MSDGGERMFAESGTPETTPAKTDHVTRSMDSAFQCMKSSK
jgi:hypothetical protein